MAIALLTAWAVMRPHYLHRTPFCDTTPYGMRENAHEEAHTHVLGVG